MRLFGKTVSKKVKNDLLLRMLFILLAGILLLSVVGVSFGWFSLRKRVSPQGMQIRISADRYDVLVARTTEFDTGYSFIAGSDELKDKLSEDDFSLTYSSTDDSYQLAYEMVNEYVHDGKRYLMPGSYGTVTFYLRPHDGVDDFVANFSLATGGYVLAYDEETPVLQKVTSSAVLKMLKGHILFFTGRTGATHETYVYTGLVDGAFSYDSSEHVLCSDPGKTDCYKVVLYWEWPVTYSDIADNLSTTSPAITKKYPASVGTHIAAHPEYFFPVTPSSNATEELSDLYNDGDQTIGDGANCVVLYLDAM